MNKKVIFLCLSLEKVIQISYFLWYFTLVNISIRK